MGQTSSHIVQQRISLVFDKICEGYTSRAIIQFVSEKTDWGVTDRQIYTYIQKALKQYIKESKINKEGEIGKAMVRYQLLFSRCMKIQDYKTALQVQKEITELIGIKAKQAVETTGETTIKIIYAEGDSQGTRQEA